jgi:hypothetical protein
VENEQKIDQYCQYAREKKKKMEPGSKSGLLEAAISNKGEKITGGDWLNLK